MALKPHACLVPFLFTLSVEHLLGENSFSGQSTVLPFPCSCCVPQGFHPHFVKKTLTQPTLSSGGHGEMRSSCTSPAVHPFHSAESTVSHLPTFFWTTQASLFYLYIEKWHRWRNPWTAQIIWIEIGTTPTKKQIQEQRPDSNVSIH